MVSGGRYPHMILIYSESSPSFGQLSCFHNSSVLIVIPRRNKSYDVGISTDQSVLLLFVGSPRLRGEPRNDVLTKIKNLSLHYCRDRKHTSCGATWLDAFAPAHTYNHTLTSFTSGHSVLHTLPAVHWAALRCVPMLFQSRCHRQRPHFCSPSEVHSTLAYPPRSHHPRLSG